MEVEQFHELGFFSIENFLSKPEILQLKNACERIVDEMQPENHSPTIFTTADQNQSRNKYFLESGDKIRFFFEQDAVDENGILKVNKHFALNKIGHALHWLDADFKEISFSNKVKTLVRDLGFECPALVQSMYIFKQPKFGAEVNAHKDSTFLSTTPESCIGLWFALEDADLDNGCLWFEPGSHKTPTKRRFIRNPDPNGPLTLIVGEKDESDPQAYVPVPVKAGSLIIIHGAVNHKSGRNTSERSRHIYTFHVIETKNTVWSDKNWLQPTTQMPFSKLYEN